MLRSGYLRRLIDEDGVAGVTSNPTIFHKAITAGSTYDEEIADLVSRGAGTEEIMEALMLKDIGMAAAELRPVYEATGISMASSASRSLPGLAYDTMATEAEVRRIRALCPTRTSW